MELTMVSAKELTRVGAIVLTLVGAVALARVGAQTDTATPAFEVASVKPSHAATPDVHVGLRPGGLFSAENVPAWELVRSAYGVSNFQLADAPDWTRSERFDIVARARGNPGPPEVFLMLRALLAERFHLVVHHEMREMPVYALVRSGAALGPQLRPAAADCDAITAGARRGQPPPASARMLCGTRMRGPGHMEQGGRTLAQIAESFSPIAGRTVIDRTGIEGRYDLDLDFAPEPSAGNPAPATSDAPSIFTAVREQLGLRLESTKAPVDVLVVDRIERPSAD